MDIRTVKTQKAIKEAFIELRSQKSLEKISVKELCQKAQINKSTFYTYYDDIYSLSDTVEKETVAYILNGISQRIIPLRIRKPLPGKSAWHVSPI